jgi:glycosyltransferase involved in cell wall biosynthesis
MLNTNNDVWITWEIQRRNRSMSLLLGVSLYEMITSRKGFSRYVELVIRTFCLVARKNPNRVFIQNPSIVLNMFILLLKPVFRFRLIVDEHNAGIYPLEGRSRLLNFFARTIVRFADIVIVTNQSLADVCEEWGGNPVIKPDPLPTLQMSGSDDGDNKCIANSESPFTFLFICSWATDEPYEELIKSASKLDQQDMELRITGRFPDRFKCGVAKNVKLLGFLTEEDYVRELFTCSAVIVLTNRENCLNCGAYEAVSAGKPGVLSDKEILRSYFHQGFIFTTNNSVDIARAVYDVKDQADALQRKVQVLRHELLVKDRATAENLSTAISQLQK